MFSASVVLMEVQSTSKYAAPADAYLRNQGYVEYGAPKIKRYLFAPEVLGDLATSPVETRGYVYGTRCLLNIFQLTSSQKSFLKLIHVHSKEPASACHTAFQILS